METTITVPIGEFLFANVAALVILFFVFFIAATDADSHGNKFIERLEIAMKASAVLAFFSFVAWAIWLTSYFYRLNF